MSSANLTFQSGAFLLCPHRQQTAIDMGLNFKTYVLLLWIADRMSNDKHRQIVDGERCYMVDYDEIAQALPMLSTNRETIRTEHFSRLDKLGFIIRKQSYHTIGTGTQTGIVLGGNYYKLFRHTPQSHCDGTTTGIEQRNNLDQEQNPITIQNDRKSSHTITGREKTPKRRVIQQREGLPYGQ